MAKSSAGLLVYRCSTGAIEVLLVHPGGPLFKNKDVGAWSIPKGEVGPDEDFLSAAVREFQEETGFVPSPPFEPLSAVKQKGGKIVWAWMACGDFDLSKFLSNTFEIDWPPNSGRIATFPEADRAEYFQLPIARSKINPAQIAFLDELETRLAGDKN